MNVKQWLKLVIDVLELVVGRIGADDKPESTMPRTSESTEFADGQGVMVAPLPIDGSEITTSIMPDNQITPDPITQLHPSPSEADPKVILDAEGIPHDERIHGSGKTFLAKTGCWKLKRGVDPVLVAKVKSELTIAHGAKDTVVPPLPIVSPAPTDTVTTWAQLMDKVAAAETHPDTVLAACNKFNVANIGTLQDTPVLVPLVATELGF